MHREVKVTKIVNENILSIILSSVDSNSVHFIKYKVWENTLFIKFWILWQCKVKTSDLNFDLSKEPVCIFCQIYEEPIRFYWYSYYNNFYLLGGLKMLTID